MYMHMYVCMYVYLCACFDTYVWVTLSAQRHMNILCMYVKKYYICVYVNLFSPWVIKKLCHPNNLVANHLLSENFSNKSLAN